jgi:predicted nucleotidyltransferase
MNRTIQELAENFAELEDVEALVLGGSVATGLADELSDYDLCAYTRGVAPIEFRAKLLKPRTIRLIHFRVAAMNCEDLQRCRFAASFPEIKVWELVAPIRKPPRRAALLTTTANCPLYLCFNHKKYGG